MAAKNSLWFYGGTWHDKTSFENVLLYGKHVFTRDCKAELKCCTAPGLLRFDGEPNSITDSIVRSVEAAKASPQIDRVPRLRSEGPLYRPCQAGQELFYR